MRILPSHPGYQELDAAAGDPAVRILSGATTFPLSPRRSAPRSKLGQADLPRNVIPGEDHRHIASDLFGGDAHDIGEKTGAFLKLDQGDDIGEITEERRVVGLPIYDLRIDCPATGREDPLSPENPHLTSTGLLR